MWGGILGPQICHGQNIEDTPNHGKSSCSQHGPSLDSSVHPKEVNATADTLMVVYIIAAEKKNNEENFPDVSSMNQPSPLKESSITPVFFWFNAVFPCGFV